MKMTRIKAVALAVQKRVISHGVAYHLCLWALHAA